MHFLKKMGLMLLVASCFITAASAGEVELLNIGKSKTAAFCRKIKNGTQFPLRKQHPMRRILPLMESDGVRSP